MASAAPLVFLLAVSVQQTSAALVYPLVVPKSSLFALYSHETGGFLPRTLPITGGGHFLNFDTSSGTLYFHQSTSSGGSTGTYSEKIVRFEVTSHESVVESVVPALVGTAFGNQIGLSLNNTGTYYARDLKLASDGNLYILGPSGVGRITPATGATFFMGSLSPTVTHGDQCLGVDPAAQKLYVMRQGRGATAFNLHTDGTIDGASAVTDATVDVNECLFDMTNQRVIFEDTVGGANPDLIRQLDLASFPGGFGTAPVVYTQVNNQNFCSAFCDSVTASNKFLASIATGGIISLGGFVEEVSVGSPSTSALFTDLTRPVDMIQIAVDEQYVEDVESAAPTILASVSVFSVGVAVVLAATV
jgi:hypothetical protein